MRRAPSLLLILLLVMVAPHAGAEDEGKADLPQRLTENQGADIAIQAHAAGAKERLRQLAARDAPDPWLVADELCRRGKQSAAAAFARVAPRPATAKLAAYVDEQATRADDADARRVWATIQKAFGQGNMQAAAAAPKALEGAPSSVVRVRIAYLQGIALFRLRRVEMAVDHLLRAAAAAHELGWLAGAVSAYAEGARAAYQRSDWPRALTALRAAHTLQVTLGDTHNAARSLAMIGLLHQKLGAYDASLEAQSQALEALRKAKDEIGAATTLGNIGLVHVQRGDYAQALLAFREALAFWEAREQTAHVASTLGHIGVVQEKLGDYVDALGTLERALALQEARNDLAGMTRTRANIGNALTGLSDFLAALRIQEQVLEAKREFRDRAGEALTIGNIGTIYWHLADYPQALQMHRRALALQRRVQDRHGEATSLGNIGATLLEFGDYAASLRALDEALAIQRSIKDRAGAASTTGNIGRLYMELGDHEKAWAMLERSLGISSELKNRAGMGWALSQMGVLKQRVGEFEEALKIHLRALALRRAVGNKAGAAFVTSEIGVLRRELGQFTAAVDAQKQAIAEGKALHDRDVVVHARGHLGLTYLRMDKPQLALAELEDAVREARELRIAPILLRFLGPLARLRLETGDAGRALAEARSGLRDLEDILGGLGEEEGALARERYADLFEIGALAAMRLGDAKEAFTFLESGRASMLLESLKGRRALRWTDLPAALRKEEAQAKAREARARHELNRSLKRGKMDDARAAKKRLDAARERQRDVSARIQREAKRQAGLFYPRATTLPKLQKRLAPDTALVLFGLCTEQALALVITTGDARFVELGRVAELRAACAGLDPEDVETKPATALAKLRQVLIAPLALDDSIRRLLLSPDGSLCYLPWGLLFEHRAVALVPSGTTYVLLREDARGPGKGVLALGDPLYGKHVDAGAAAVYRGGRALPRLPATRTEVEAVGTVRLLDKDAHEQGLREALALRPRWRAVHLACHGLIDPERPMLSSLALTHAGDDDGFLTCLEVLRSHIPADLAVLSACSTGKGRTYRAEGIVGLMRAFMYAGAPRVICSLWDVDDKATLALMKEFYARWNPSTGKGESAATALREAQAHVRAQKGWEHPYYWAAWILWGLPD